MHLLFQKFTTEVVVEVDKVIYLKISIAGQQNSYKFKYADR